jgi:hypothetical protein
VNDILKRARDRGLTRLCHFTRAVNLPHILVTGEIRSAGELASSAESFRCTDMRRHDGRPHQICCSLEYPNAWYLDYVRAADRNFRDWVVLAFDLDLLSSAGVSFCPVNSARSKGARISEATLESFEALFAQYVIGNALRARLPGHPDWWPTDDQAEVLLSVAVPAAKIRRILVEGDSQAAMLHHQLRAQHLEDALPPIFVAPGLFDKYSLSKAIRIGIRPKERLFVFSGPLTE